MKKFTVFAAATIISVAAATSSVAGSVYLNQIQEGMGCFDTGNKDLKCSTQAQRDAYYKAEILPALKRMGYPGKITVTDPADMPAARDGWKTSGACANLHPHTRSKDPRINNAKITFCKLRSAGFDVPKPKIIARY